MTPKIEHLAETKLIGQRTTMSFANNKTPDLWRSFIPRRKEIANQANNFLYSVEQYSDTDFFKQFKPTREFEKWAAVGVTDFDTIPEGMETLTIPAGTYAVFHYKGKPSQAQATFQYIFSQWLPQSGYTLDDRPHFALMGDKYLGEHDDSEEEFWVPVVEK